MDSRFVNLKRIRCFTPLVGTALMQGIAMSFTEPYLPLFGVGEAHWTPWKLGLFMTLMASSGVLASAWAGAWSDMRGHHRKLLLISSATASLGFLLLGYTRHYLTLLVVGVGLLGPGGAATSLIFSLAPTSLEFRDDAQRALALSTLRMVLSVAWVFAPALGALVLAIGSFRGLFLVAAACFGACGVVIWHRCKSIDRRCNCSSAVDAVNPGSSLDVRLGSERSGSARLAVSGGYVLTQRVWLAAGALTLIGLATNATMIVLPLYVVKGLKGTRFDVSIMSAWAHCLKSPSCLLSACVARLSTS